MTVADLLDRYADSLMARMSEQCPVLYDPRRDADTVEIAASPRKLFTAQAHATRAIVKVIQRDGAAILLGEIGSGKSTVATVAARSMGARSVLVMCPPHLLDGWKNELRAVVPDASVYVASTVEDLDTIAFQRNLNRDFGGFTFTIMSREAAKLSHAWEDASGKCPRCGEPIPTTGDLGKKRTRCAYKPLRAKNELAQIAVAFARYMMPFAPTEELIGQLLPRWWDRRQAASYASQREYYKPGERGHRVYSGLPREYLHGAISKLAEMARHADYKIKPGIERAIVLCVLASNNDPDTVVHATRAMLGPPPGEQYYHGAGRELLHLLPKGNEAQASIPEEYKP